jgi:hypothetical protein
MMIATPSFYTIMANDFRISPRCSRMFTRGTRKTEIIARIRKKAA